MSTASGTPILSARGLRKEYGKDEGLVRAVETRLTGGASGHLGALAGLEG